MFDVCVCDDDETLNEQTTFKNLASYSGDLRCRVINFNLSEFFILYHNFVSLYIPSGKNPTEIIRVFGYFTNKPSLKRSFHRRPQARSVLKLEREENEKGLKAGLGGIRTEIARITRFSLW